MLHINCWGGVNTVAHSLWKFRKNHPDSYKKNISKVRVITIDFQDEAGDWIVNNMPEVRIIRYNAGKNENATNLPAIAGDPATLEKGLISRDDIIFFGGFEQGYNNASWKNRWGISWMNRATDNEVVVNGWTLRFMWRSKGKLVIYAYVPKSKNCLAGLQLPGTRRTQPGLGHRIYELHFGCGCTFRNGDRAIRKTVGNGCRYGFQRPDSAPYARKGS